MENKKISINISAVFILILSGILVLESSSSFRLNNLIDNTPIMTGLPFYIGSTVLIIAMVTCNFLFLRKISKRTKRMMLTSFITFLIFIAYTGLMIPKGYRVIDYLEPMIAILGFLTYFIVIINTFIEILSLNSIEINADKNEEDQNVILSTIIKSLVMMSYISILCFAPLYGIFAIAGATPTDEYITIEGKEYILRDNSTYDFTDSKSEVDLYSYFEKVNAILYRENEEIKNYIEN